MQGCGPRPAPADLCLGAAGGRVVGRVHHHAGRRTAFAEPASSPSSSTGPARPDFPPDGAVHACRPWLAAAAALVAGGMGRDAGGAASQPAPAGRRGAGRAGGGAGPVTVRGDRGAVARRARPGAREPCLSRQSLCALAIWIAAHAGARHGDAVLLPGGQPLRQAHSAPRRRPSQHLALLALPAGHDALHRGGHGPAAEDALMAGIRRSEKSGARSPRRPRASGASRSAPSVWALHFIVSYAGTAVYCAKLRRRRLRCLSRRDRRADGGGARLHRLARLAVLAAVARPSRRRRVRDRRCRRRRRRAGTAFSATPAFLLSLIAFVGVIYVSLPVVFIGGCI